MSKKKPISKDTFITAAASMLNNGTSIRQVMKDYNISQRDARFLSRNFGLCADEFRKLIINKTQIIAEETLDKIREKLDKIPPGQLAVTYGILIDKLHKAEAENEDFNNQDKDEVRFGSRNLTYEEIKKILCPGSNAKVRPYKNPDIIDCTPPEAYPQSRAPDEEEKDC